MRNFFQTNFVDLFLKKYSLLLQKEFTVKPKILMTTKSDAQEDWFEQIGENEITTISHFSGLWYGDYTGTSVVEHHRDLAKIAEIVREAETRVIIFAGCTSRALPTSTINVGKFLVDNTSVHSVLMFTTHGLDKYSEHWVRGTLFCLTSAGLKVVEQCDKIDIDNLFKLALETAKTLNCPKTK